VHGDHLFGARDQYPASAQAMDQAYRANGNGNGNGSSHASELSKLSDLHDRGVLTDAEFQQGKEKILQ
jgi:hypothetical protein